MSGRVRTAVARRFLAGFLPVVLLLAFAIDRPAFAADRFPLALKDDRGVTVRLAAPPRRVVSLAPSLTEIVFLLGRDGFPRRRHPVLQRSGRGLRPAEDRGRERSRHRADRRAVAGSRPVHDGRESAGQGAGPRGDGDPVLRRGPAGPGGGLHGDRAPGPPPWRRGPGTRRGGGASPSCAARASLLRRRGKARRPFRRLHRADHRRRRRHLHGRTGASRRREERRRALFRQVPAALRGGVGRRPAGRDLRRGDDRRRTVPAGGHPLEGGPRVPGRRRDHPRRGPRDPPRPAAGDRARAGIRGSRRMAD